MPLAPGDRVGATVVEAPIGRGGMASVYRVRHTELGAIFALKVLDQVTADLTERFRLEGRIQATLNHPHVVRVFDLVEAEGRPALLMEFVDGPTLREWWHTEPSEAELEKVFVQIVRGVHAAHQVGLVHRDLKPANVLIGRGGEGEPIAKIVDFGVAKLQHEEGATRTGWGMGTPGYMAPEQARNAKDVDHRADVFALGVLLYEMMCRQPPFGGPDPFARMQAATEGRYRPPSELRPELPDRVVRTIEACLEPAPARRLPHCSALLASLGGAEPLPTPTAEATWAPQPAPASLTTTPPPAARPGRDRVLWGVGFAVLACVLGGLAVGVAGQVWELAIQAPEPGVDRIQAEALVVRAFEIPAPSPESWLGKALASDVASALVGVGGPRVVSRSALQRYERIPGPSQLGEDLDVDVVIEGRVERLGETLVVHVSAVSTDDEAVVWTDTVTGSVGALTGPEGRVAQAVLEAFGHTLDSPSLSPVRLEAQPFFLKGREIVRDYDELRYAEAETALVRAVEIDPTYADARAALARLYLHKGWHGEYAESDLVTAAEEQVRQALRDEPTHAESLRVLGRAMILRGELRGAYGVLNLSIQHDPRSAEAYIDRYEAEVRAGAVELAAADLDRAEDLDPHYVRVYTNQAWLTTYRQRWDQLDPVLARAQARGVQHPWLHRARAESLRRSRRDDALQAHLARHPEPLSRALHERDEAWLSRRVQAMAPLGRERPNGVIERARYEAALGDTEAALASLRIALGAYPGWLAHTVDPVFDEVRAHPDWSQLESTTREAGSALTRAFEEAR